MPRNGSGTYSLPAGNPVVSGTTIQATWANSTLADISTELTGSLARSGAGGMLGALRGVDGTVSVPAFSFTSETTSGFYRAGTGDVRFAMAGADVYTVTTSAVTFAAAIATTGTASATKFIPTGGSATGNGMYLPAANTLAWSNNGSETMRLDSSGNLGLGVTPSAWGGNYKTLQLPAGSLQAYTTSTIQISQNGYDSGAGSWKYVSTNLASRYDQTAGAHSWYIAPSGTAGDPITFTQAMTLDASGHLLIAKTTSADTTVGAAMLSNGRVTSTMSSSTSSDSTLHVYSTGASAYRFYVNMAGSINATSTTITAISDQRLKENIRDLEAGLPEIMALKPRTFDWKPGKGKDKKNDRGWIAQEFQQVFPDMVSTWLDPAPEGEEPYKSVGADLIPVLVKAMQEQQAIITDLRARVAALEAA